MDKITIAKRVVSAAVGWSVAGIVSAVVKNNTDPEKPLDKAAVAIGTWALGGIAADAARGYTDAKVDEIVAWFIETKEKIQNR